MHPYVLITNAKENEERTFVTSRALELVFREFHWVRRRGEVQELGVYTQLLHVSFEAPMTPQIAVDFRLEDGLRRSSEIFRFPVSSSIRLVR